MKKIEISSLTFGKAATVGLYGTDRTHGGDGDTLTGPGMFYDPAIGCVTLGTKVGDDLVDEMIPIHCISRMTVAEKKKKQSLSDIPPME